MPNTLRYQDALKFVHLTSNSTAINRSGRAVLQRVVVNDPAAQTLTIYDNNEASGQVVAVIDCNNSGSFEYQLVLTNGLTVELSGTADVTVVYE